MTVKKILDQRKKTHGDFNTHAVISQQIKSVMAQHGVHELDPNQIEALEMIAHKIARILNGDPTYADSWVDIAGYAKRVADRLEGVEL
jgi:hypothetical protein